MKHELSEKALRALSAMQNCVPDGWLAVIGLADNNDAPCKVIQSHRALVAAVVATYRQRIMVAEADCTLAYTLAEYFDLLYDDAIEHMGNDEVRP